MLLHARQNQFLTNAMIKNRHINVCLAVLVQSIRAVPQKIRMNCIVFQLAAFKNQKVVLSDIHEEVSNVIWMSLRCLMITLQQRNMAHSF